MEERRHAGKARNQSAGGMGSKLRGCSRRLRRRRPGHGPVSRQLPTFSQIVQLGHSFVVRLRCDRRAKLADADSDDQQWSSLAALAIEVQGLFTREVPLSKRGAKGAPDKPRLHPPRDARCALLHFGAVPVEDLEATLPAQCQSFPASLPLWMVRVWETDAPSGEIQSSGC